MGQTSQTKEAGNFCGSAIFRARIKGAAKIFARNNFYFHINTVSIAAMAASPAKTPVMPASFFSPSFTSPFPTATMRANLSLGSWTPPAKGNV